MRGQALLTLAPTLLVCLAAFSCSPRVAQDPLRGQFRIQISPNKGFNARVIEAEKEWHYSLFWMGDIPEDEVLVAELIDGEVTRTAIYTQDPRLRFSSWNSGVRISKETFYKKTGTSRYKHRQPDEWLEPPDPFRQPPIEGDEYAADNPSILLEIQIFEVSRTGRISNYGNPEIEMGKLLASDKHSLSLHCMQCQASLERLNELQRVVSVGSVSVLSAVYFPVLDAG